MQGCRRTFVKEILRSRDKSLYSTCHPIAHSDHEYGELAARGCYSFLSVSHIYGKAVAIYFSKLSQCFFYQDNKQDATGMQQNFVRDRPSIFENISGIVTVYLLLFYLLAFLVFLHRPILIHSSLSKKTITP